jgi:hypothetical protein
MDSPRPDRQEAKRTAVASTSNLLDVLVALLRNGHAHRLVA